MKRARRVAAGISIVMLAVGCSSDGSPPAGAASGPEIVEAGGAYRVAIDPNDFVAEIDNPYFPLTPGDTWRLEGVTDEGNEVDTISVTDRTRVVMGVTTTVVEDVVTLNGKLAEKTLDWYAQDVDGNVWYFGEDTAEYEHGKKVGSHGSWEAGVDGALPGIIMTADPESNDARRQEFYRGEAEDMFWVVETGVTKEVPFGSFDHVIHTLEWSPLEPAVVGEKFYARGVGLIWERSLAGGRERFELVEHRGP